MKRRRLAFRLLLASMSSVLGVAGTGFAAPEIPGHLPGVPYCEVCPVTRADLGHFNLVDVHADLPAHGCLGLADRFTDQPPTADVPCYPLAEAAAEAAQAEVTAASDLDGEPLPAAADEALSAEARGAEAQGAAAPADDSEGGDSQEGQTFGYEPLDPDSLDSWDDAARPESSPEEPADEELADGSESDRFSIEESPSTSISGEAAADPIATAEVDLSAGRADSSEGYDEYDAYGEYDADSRNGGSSDGRDDYGYDYDEFVEAYRSGPLAPAAVDGEPEEAAEAEEADSLAATTDGPDANGYDPYDGYDRTEDLNDGRYDYGYDYDEYVEAYRAAAPTPDAADADPVEEPMADADSLAAEETPDSFEYDYDLAADAESAADAEPLAEAEAATPSAEGDADEYGYDYADEYGYEYGDDYGYGRGEAAPVVESAAPEVESDVETTAEVAEASDEAASEASSAAAQATAELGPAGGSDEPLVLTPQPAPEPVESGAGQVVIELPERWLPTTGQALAGPAAPLYGALYLGQEAAIKAQLPQRAGDALRRLEQASSQATQAAEVESGEAAPCPAVDQCRREAVATAESPSEPIEAASQPAETGSPYQRTRSRVLRGLSALLGGLADAMQRTSTQLAELAGDDTAQLR